MNAAWQSDENEAVALAPHPANTAIAMVTINRPRQRNAIDDDVIAGLERAAGYLRDDISIKAIVLAGAGGFFSAGADISTFARIQAETDVNRVRRLTHAGGRLCRTWESLPQLTIAAIEGGAIGGGLALAAACDWRLMASDAWVYVPETRLGLNYGWNVLPRLNSLIGPARAKTISILGRRHGASECEKWGLADGVTEKGGAVVGALALADEVCSLPRLPVQLIKRSVNAHAQALASASSYGDMDDMLVCMTDPEAGSARDAFIAKLQTRGGA